MFMTYNIEHPLNYIEQYVLSGKIDFPIDSNHLFSCRQKIMKKIKEYFNYFLILYFQFVI